MAEGRIGHYYVGKRKVYYALPSSRRSLAQPDYQSPPPTSDLRLEYIYGYNGKVCRNNLFYTQRHSKRPRVVYSIAGVGVRMDP